jgi:hypothetical protein
MARSTVLALFALLAFAGSSIASSEFHSANVVELSSATYDDKARVTDVQRGGAHVTRSHSCNACAPICPATPQVSDGKVYFIK